MYRGNVTSLLHCSSRVNQESVAPQEDQVSVETVEFKDPKAKVVRKAVRAPLAQQETEDAKEGWDPKERGYVASVEGYGNCIAVLLTCREGEDDMA